MKLRVSNYATTSNQEENPTWLHRLTGERLGLPENYEALIEEMVQLDWDQVQAEPKQEFLRFLALELKDRGYLIPENLSTPEEKWVSQLRPLKLVNSGFFHCPTAKIEALPESPSIVFMGIPCDLGASKPGTRKGPNLMRERSQALTFRGERPSSLFNLKTGQFPLSQRALFDLGDFSLPDFSLSEWLEVVSQTVAKLPVAALPVVIGGDHTFTLSTVSALKNQKREPFTLLQLDNHLDVQTWGNFKQSKPDFLSPAVHSNFISHLKERFPELPVVQCGVRSYQSFSEDPEGQIPLYLKNIGQQICDWDVRELSAQAIVDQIPTEHVYVSLDVDVLAQEFMEPTGYPSAVGVPFEKISSLLKAVAKKRKVIGIDIMELGAFSPLDGQRAAAERVVYLLLQMLEQLP